MEDAKIIDLYFSRNEQAITETNQKYGSYCYTIAQNILRSHPDSEECVNDTWLRAWYSMPPQKPGRLGLFLGKITRNLSVDRFRSWNAEKRGNGETTLVLEELGTCADVTGDPADAAEMKLLQESIGKFLQSLPRREQGVFLRRYFYAENIADIARLYEIKEANVRLILSRTRQKLKSFLQKEGFFI